MLEIKTIPSQALFKASDAARFQGISKDTLLRMAKEGEIPAYRFRSRVVFKLEDLEEIIRSLKRYHGSSPNP